MSVDAESLSHSYIQTVLRIPRVQVGPGIPLDVFPALALQDPPRANPITLVASTPVTVCSKKPVRGQTLLSLQSGTFLKNMQAGTVTKIEVLD